MAKPSGKYQHQSRAIQMHHRLTILSFHRRESRSHYTQPTRGPDRAKWVHPSSAPHQRLSVPRCQCPLQARALFLLPFEMRREQQLEAEARACLLPCPASTCFVGGVSPL